MDLDLNLVTLYGKVAAPPELREFEHGSKLFRMLVTVRSEKPRRRVDVIPVTYWDPPEGHDLFDAEVGDRIWVIGTLQRRFWESADGRRSRIECVAGRVEIINVLGDDEKEDVKGVTVQMSETGSTMEVQDMSSERSKLYAILYQVDVDNDHHAIGISLVNAAGRNNALEQMERIWFNEHPDRHPQVTPLGVTHLPIGEYESVALMPVSVCKPIMRSFSTGSSVMQARELAEAMGYERVQPF